MEHILNIYDTIQLTEEDTLSETINLRETLHDVGTLSFEQTIRASFGVKPTVYRDHTISKEVWYDEDISKCRDVLQLKEYFYLDGVDQGWPLPTPSSPSFDKNPIATFQEIPGSEFFTRFPNAKILSAFFKWLKDLAEWHGYPIQPTFNKIKGDSVEVPYTPTSDETDLAKYPWNFKNYFNDINQYVRENIPDYALLFNYWYSGTDDTDFKYTYETKLPVGYMREQYLDFGSKSKYERDSYWRLFPVKLVKTSGPATCKMYYSEIRQNPTAEFYTDRCDYRLKGLDDSTSNYLKIRVSDGVSTQYDYYIGQPDVTASSIRDTINSGFSDLGLSISVTVSEEFNGVSVDSENIRVYRVIFTGSIDIGTGSGPFVQFNIEQATGSYTNDTTSLGSIIPQSKRAIATDGGSPSSQTDMRAIWGYLVGERISTFLSIRLVDIENGGEYYIDYKDVASMSDLETFINTNLPITVSLSLVSSGDTTLDPAVKFENYAITSTTPISDLIPGGGGLAYNYFSLNKRTANVVGYGKVDVFQIQVPIDYATVLADDPTSYEKYCPNGSPFISTTLTKMIQWTFTESGSTSSNGQSSLAKVRLKAALKLTKSKCNYIIPLKDLNLRTRYGIKSSTKVATLKLLLENDLSFYVSAFAGHSRHSIEIDLPTDLSLKYCFVDSIPRIVGNLTTNISESEFDTFLAQIDAATKYDISTVTVTNTNPDLGSAPPVEQYTEIEQEVVIPDDFYETDGKYLIVQFDCDNLPNTISITDSDYFCNWSNFYTNPEFYDDYTYTIGDILSGRIFGYTYGNRFVTTSSIDNPYKYQWTLSDILAFALDGYLYGFIGSNYYFSP